MSVAALLLLLGLQTTADWPTYHGGYSLDGVAAVPPPDAPKRLWRHKAPGPVELAPVSAAGRIHILVKNRIQTLDLQGRLLWERALDGDKDRFNAPPMVAEGRVLAGTRDGKLHAYAASDGKLLWTYDTEDGIQGSPNRIELEGGRPGVVVIAQSGGVLHALDLETGKASWKSDPVDRADGSPGSGAGRIVMGSCASALHVFAADTGTKAPDLSLGGECQVAGGVAIRDGIAYAGGRTGKVVAADLAASRILWTNEDTRKEAFTTPAVGEKALYFGADDGRLYALDRATGRQLWNYDTRGTPSSAIVAGNRVVVASAGSVHLLDAADGKAVAVLKVGDELAPPALVNGVLILGADDGTVSAWGRE
jgi:outer membrane protein assembly factor BamB